jgi:hypothetical protein
MSNIEDDNDTTETIESLCNGCEYMVSRQIIPYDLEDIGLEDIDPEDMLDDDGNFIPFVHIICTKLNLELNHLVLTCSKFRRTGYPNSLNNIHNFFLDNVRQK